MEVNTTIEAADTRLDEAEIRAELFGLQDHRRQVPSLDEVQRRMPRANGDQDTW